MRFTQFRIIQHRKGWLNGRLMENCRTGQNGFSLQFQPSLRERCLLTQVIHSTNLSNIATKGILETWENKVADLLTVTEETSFRWNVDQCV